MKVLYFTRDDSVHDRRFLSAITSAKMDVLLLRLQGGTESLLGLPKAVKEITWQNNSKNQSLQTKGRIVELARIVREYQPDLIHAGPLTNCAHLASLTGFQPLVSMSWGSDILAPKAWDFRANRILRRTLENSSVLICDCRAVKQKATAMGFPSERIVVFPWGIDLKCFSPGSGITLRKKWGLEDQFIVLSLRSWEPIYGVDITLKAFIIAVKENPRLSLILGGQGSQDGEIRNLIQKHGVENKIRFLGQIPQKELPDVYRASDLYVSSSQSDGSSVTLLEALACGKPALVSDIPGNREWVTEGQNGWLFRDGHVQELASLMLSIPKEKNLLKKVALNNRQLSKEKADWKKNSKGLIRAYDLALELKGSV